MSDKAIKEINETKVSEGTEIDLKNQKQEEPKLTDNNILHSKKEEEIKTLEKDDSIILKDDDKVIEPKSIKKEVEPKVIEPINNNLNIKPVVKEDEINLIKKESTEKEIDINSIKEEQLVKLNEKDDNKEIKLNDKEAEIKLNEDKLIEKEVKDKDIQQQQQQLKETKDEVIEKKIEPETKNEIVDAIKEDKVTEVSIDDKEKVLHTKASYPQIQDNEIKDPLIIEDPGLSKLLVDFNPLSQISFENSIKEELEKVAAPIIGDINLNQLDLNTKEKDDVTNNTLHEESKSTETKCIEKEPLIIKEVDQINNKETTESKVIIDDDDFGLTEQEAQELLNSEKALEKKKDDDNSDLGIQIYGSSVSGNYKIKKAQTKMLDTLDRFNIKYEFIDLAADDEAKKFIKRANPSSTAIPQLYIGGQFKMEFDEFEELMEYDELFDALGVEPDF